MENEFLPGKETKITEKEMSMALNLIDSMTEEWDPKEYKNEYSEALMKWIDEKAKLGGADPKESVEGSPPRRRLMTCLLSLRRVSKGRRR